MKKTAALNKLALAVKNYVQSEQQFNKIAATLQQYQHQGMQKEAQGILQRLGLTAPPPVAKSNMGRNAALAALLLGGGAAGANAAGLFGGGEGAGATETVNELARQAGDIFGKIEKSPYVPEGAPRALRDIAGSIGSGAGNLADNTLPQLEAFIRNLTGKQTNEDWVASNPMPNALG